MFVPYVLREFFYAYFGFISRFSVLFTYLLVLSVYSRLHCAFWHCFGSISPFPVTAVANVHVCSTRIHIADTRLRPNFICGPNIHAFVHTSGGQQRGHDSRMTDRR